jgi:hypothetical protein
MPAVTRGTEDRFVCRMRLPAMKTVALASSAAALLAVAACDVPGPAQPSPSPAPLPSADVTVAYGDTNGTFFLGLDRTMLVKIPDAAVHWPGMSMTAIGRAASPS